MMTNAGADANKSCRYRWNSGTCPGIRSVELIRSTPCARSVKTQACRKFTLLPELLELGNPLVLRGYAGKQRAEPYSKIEGIVTAEATRDGEQGTAACECRLLRVCAGQQSSCGECADDRARTCGDATRVDAYFRFKWSLLWLNFITRHGRLCADGGEKHSIRQETDLHSKVTQR